MEESEIVYRVEGMSCEGCVSAVERALLEIPGIVSVSADLESSSARVSVEGEAPVFTVLADAVSAVGYGLVQD
jgi:copper chaperone CopZ